MTNKILITVSYLVETDKYDFWDRETGYLQDSISDYLDMRFPEKVKLPNDIQAKRISLSHGRIDYPSSNAMTCPVCKCLMTDPTKPNPVQALKQAKELEGVLMCSSCAWQLEYDILCGRSIESIMEKYKEP